MLSGKEKAQVLLSLLGDQAQEILSIMSPEASNLLMSSIDNAPVLEAHELNQVLEEVVSKVEEIKLMEDTEELPTEEVIEEQIEKEESLEATSEEEDSGIEEEESELEEDQEGQVKFRDTGEIAKLLSKQSPQVIKFVLSQVKLSLREEIKEKLPTKVKEEVSKLSIEHTPMEGKIFSQIYEKIFLETE